MADYYPLMARAVDGLSDRRRRCGAPSTSAPARRSWSSCAPRSAALRGRHRARAARPRGRGRPGRGRAAAQPAAPASSPPRAGMPIGLRGEPPPPAQPPRRPGPAACRAADDARPAAEDRRDPPRRRRGTRPRRSGRASRAGSPRVPQSGRGAHRRPRRGAGRRDRRDRGCGLALRDRPADLRAGAAVAGRRREPAAPETAARSASAWAGGPPPARRRRRRPRGDVAVAQRAMLYEENQADPQAPKATAGRAVWRLDDLNAGQGQPLETVVRANVDVPDARLTLSLVLRRNPDQTLPASHTVELDLHDPAGRSRPRRPGRRPAAVQERRDRARHAGRRAAGAGEREPVPDRAVEPAARRGAQHRPDHAPELDRPADPLGLRPARHPHLREGRPGRAGR